MLVGCGDIIPDPKGLFLQTNKLDFYIILYSLFTYKCGNDSAETRTSCNMRVKQDAVTMERPDHDDFRGNSY